MHQNCINQRGTQKVLFLLIENNYKWKYIKFNWRAQARLPVDKIENMNQAALSKPTSFDYSFIEKFAYISIYGTLTITRML